MGEEDWGLRDELSPLVSRVLDAHEGESPSAIRTALRRARPKAVLGSGWAQACWHREIEDQQRKRLRGDSKPRRRVASKEKSKPGKDQMNLFPDYKG